jgi:UDP-N-acetylmuramoyl-tripeptide--D-alanyl-D-alanine ligase
MVFLLSLLIFFLVPVYAVILEQITSLVYLWQIKEYRWDRVASFLRYDRELTNKEVIINITKLAVLVLALAFLISPSGSVLLISVALGFLVYVLQTFSSLQRIVGKKIHRPKLKSIRNLLVLAGSLIVVLAPSVLIVAYLFQVQASLPGGQIYPIQTGNLPDFKELIPHSVNGFLVLPLPVVLLVMATVVAVSADLVTSPAVIFMVALTGPLAYVKRTQMMNKARSIIAGHKQLKIVAITGSYGKSTTKELLFQIINEKFHAVRTPKNFNTDVGVAATIIKEVKPKTEVLIAEMGAYTKGEIASSVKVAPPDISIVTAVGEQHLSLFGSMENTFAAKYEIVEGLSSKGVAILNGNNEYCLNMAAKTDKRTIIYYLFESSKQGATEIHEDERHKEPEKVAEDENLYATDLELKPQGYHFQLSHQGERYNVQSNLKARHNVSNLLAAVAAAVELGMSLKEVAAKLNNTKFELAYLNERNAINGSTIIDDGYNSNPEGFSVALDYLDKFKAKAKKWVMVQSLIELGDSKNKVYRQLSAKIIKVADAVITTDRTLAKHLVLQKKDFKVIVTDYAIGLSQTYKEQVKSGDVVLLEGAMPTEMRSQIITHPK